MESRPGRRVVVAVTLVAMASFLSILVLLSGVEGTVRGATGCGIFDLELAWTVERASLILSVWGPEFIQLEVFGVWVDFGFIPSYATLLAGLALLVARRFEGRGRRVGFLFVWAPYVGGLMDVVENLHLLAMMSSPGAIAPHLPLMASLCSSIKFTLLGLTIGYLLAAIALQVVFSLRKSGGTR